MHRLRTLCGIYAGDDFAGAGAKSYPQVTPQVGVLLAALKGEMSREAMQSALQLQDRKSFRERYLQPALNAGWIEMTLPDKPNSRLQKYRLTAEGAAQRRQQ